MAKKRTERKNVSNNYARQFLSFLLPLFIENKEKMIKKFNELVNFKRIIKRYVILFIVTLIALIMIVEGLGMFIGSFFPNSRLGFTQIFIGLILILIVLVYKFTILRKK
jgi:hypothetical protein